MRDPWTERLSEYVDGGLPAAERTALEQHLETCDVCADTLRDLREVVAAAARLEDRGPATDLWTGIAAAIDGPHAAPDVTPLSTARRPERRSFSFSMPQLAAAAVLLMALSGGAVWLLAGGAAGGPATAAGTIVHTAGSGQLVDYTPAPEPVHTDDVAELEAVLDSNRSRLDAATIEVVERSIESIDSAIADARAALEADPGNPHLHRQLDSTMRKKVDLLRRATRGAS